MSLAAAPRRRLVGVKHGCPPLGPFRARKDKTQWIVVSVKDNEEGGVGDRFAHRIRIREAGAVQIHSERFSEAHFPVVLRHFATIRLEPADIAKAAAVKLTPLKPFAAPEHGMALAKQNEAAAELE